MSGARLTIMLGLLAALPALSIDVCIPATPTIQRDLAGTVSSVGLTMTVFMIGFAGGQFAAGPVSDRFGRRPALWSGLSAYVAATVLCALVGSAAQLAAARLLQGVAAGTCAVLAFAIIRDVFEGDAARSQRSYVTVVFGLAPMIAPGLGAVVLNAWGWRAIFYVLAASGLSLLAAVARSLPETRPIVPGFRRLGFQDAYAAVMADRHFVALSVINALSYGGLFAYIAGSSAVLIGTLGLSPGAYAAFFACTAATLTAGAWASARCARAGVGSAVIMWASLAGAAASTTVLALATGGGVDTLPVLAPLLLVNLFSRGLTAPTAQHMALDPLRQNAGTAAAALGVLQILGGAGASGIVALLLPLLGPLGMTGTMAGLAATAFALWAWLALRSAPALR